MSMQLFTPTGGPLASGAQVPPACNSPDNPQHPKTKGRVSQRPGNLDANQRTGCDRQSTMAFKMMG